MKKFYLDDGSGIDIQVYDAPQGDHSGMIPLDYGDWVALDDFETAIKEAYRRGQLQGWNDHINEAGSH